MSQIEKLKFGHEQARSHIRATIMNEFCEVMQKTGLAPIEVMRLAAEAVGVVYREVADAHSGPDACACGWRPRESDVGLLCAALMSAYGEHHLRSIQIAGTA